MGAADVEVLLHFLYTDELPALGPGELEQEGGGAAETATAEAACDVTGAGSSAPQRLLCSARALAFLGEYFGVPSLLDALDSSLELHALVLDDNEVLGAWRFARERGLEELSTACACAIEARFGTISHARGFARGTELHAD